LFMAEIIRGKAEKDTTPEERERLDYVIMEMRRMADERAYEDDMGRLRMRRAVNRARMKRGDPPAFSY
jgi:hypothetical protein